MISSARLLRSSAILAVGLGASQLWFGPLVVLLYPAPVGTPSTFLEGTPSIVAALVPLIAGVVGLLRPSVAILAGAQGWILGRLPRLLQPLFMPVVSPQAMQMMMARGDTVYLIGVSKIEMVLMLLALIGLLLCAIGELKNRSAVS